jgi:tubulin-specific chaperone B
MMESQSILAAASAYLIMDATHSHVKNHLQEIKFDEDWTIAKTKDFLEKKFGTDVGDQTLHLKDRQNVLVAEMLDDTLTLKGYGAQQGFLIHVIDSNPNAKHDQWNDVSKVEKYEISEANYDKIDDTYRNFRKRMLKNNPNYVEYAGQVEKDHQKEEADAIEIGSRCECIGGARGEVMYTGKVVGFERGYWVGVKLDEPIGDNDGTVKGKKVFDCPAGFGKIVRPLELKVGDYPEIDEFDMDDDML